MSVWLVRIHLDGARCDVQRGLERPLGIVRRSHDVPVEMDERDTRVGRRVARIDGHSALEQGEPRGVAASGVQPRLLAAAQEKLVGFNVGGPPMSQPARLAGDQLDFECGHDLQRQLVLNGEDVGEITIEAVGPDMAAADRIDQLRRDPDPPARLAHATLEYVANTECARHLGDRNRLPLIDKGRIPRDHVQPRQLGEIGDDVLANPVGEIFLLSISTHIVERPFNNMSGDAEQEYFSDGISEDIITDLSKLAGLHVIARNSSFTYKGKTVSIPEVASALGVRYILEGSVRKAGGRVRVTAQLIDFIGGGHVWANRFDRDLSDIFAVQDELTLEIVAALKVKLIAGEPSRLAHRRPANVEAYELFLRGREQSWLHTRSGNAAGLALLQRAVSIDTELRGGPRAYRVRPSQRVRHGIVWTIPSGRSGPLWTSQLAPSRWIRTSQTLTSRCPQLVLWSRDLERAVAEAALCLALSPNSAEGHLASATAQNYSGDPSAALETLDAYMRGDSVYPEITLYFVAEARFALDEFAAAVAALEQRLERNPNSETSYALLASCFGHQGRLEEARAAWAQALKIDPGFSIERRRRILPFKNRQDFERRVEGLRRAALVE